MAKELFNQTLKYLAASSDRIALGVPSIEGCDNIEVADFGRSLNSLFSEQIAFDNGDLVANVYAYTHNFGTTFIIFTIVDPNGVDRSKEFTFTIDGINDISVDFGDAIEAGTWYLNLLYIQYPVS